ncbi:dimethylsulfonioproprionate lyase family protein [Dongia sp.]|uniref:dimethylsulfonioproprionate lyase family protein n=1 Tax=Dongia sp. TaxID=1977262 RepID=UPI0035B28DB5
MNARPRDLQAFLDRSQAAIIACLSPDGEPMRVARRIGEGLRLDAPQAPRKPNRLPVCGQIAGALQTARAQGGAVAALADSFAAIEPQLAWDRRWTAKPGDAPFYDGHANATIVGPDGLEKRDDIWIGVSLLAPHVRYPDHHHPPQEIYVALSSGDWMQGSDDNWVTPGIGGHVYNRSNILHAMRSHDRPLLAIWSLWVTDRV